jgi:excisionase family DNA binding protein
MAGQAIDPSPAPTVPEWLNVEQYAARIGASPRTVYKMIRDGLPHVRPRARLIRIKVADADRWIQETTRTRPSGRVAARKGKLI